MFHAKDVMSKEVSAVGEDAPVADIIRLMVKKKITGVPVVSDDMSLLGMVTEKDILKALWYDPNIKSSSAADLMTSKIVSFDENAGLMEVFESLMKSNFRRVPILSEGKLAGIVSRRDIIEFLFEKAARPTTK